MKSKEIFIEFDDLEKIFNKVKKNGKATYYNDSEKKTLIDDVFAEIDKELMQFEEKYRADQLQDEEGKIKTEKKSDVISIVGDYNWEDVQAVLLFKLITCESEKDLRDFFTMILNATGTPEELSKMRDSLRIEKFTDEEKKQMQERLEEFKKLKDTRME